MTTNPPAPEPKVCARCEAEFTDRWWESGLATICPDCRLDDEIKYIKSKEKQ